MTNRGEIKENIKDINKEVYQSNAMLKEQNIKLHQIDGKIDNIEENLKKTDKYVSGFSSIFGFFPKLFSKSSKSKNKSQNNDQQKITNTCKTAPSALDPDDELENEIKMLQKNALEIRDQVEISLNATDNIDHKITKTNKKLDKYKIESDKIKKSYN